MAYTLQHAQAAQLMIPCSGVTIVVASTEVTKKMLTVSVMICYYCYNYCNYVTKHIY